MKTSLLLFILLVGNNISAQVDSLIVYYENGQTKSINERFNGKWHGKSKKWYESGQIWSEGKWEYGKNVQSTTYFENGKKSYYLLIRKNKVKIKMWHSNGQIWSTSVSKFSRSIEKEFDSTGALKNKLIEKKGSGLTCFDSFESEASDSLKYPDGSCSCSWGNAYWRNGIWVDEKGRDLYKNYSYRKTFYFSDGKIYKEIIWDKESEKFLEKQWDREGNLIYEGDQKL